MCSNWCVEFSKKALPYWPREARVLEVGSYNVNGSVREVFEGKSRSYVGVDVSAGPGVDEVMDARDLVAKFGIGSADVVISTELIEHVFEWPEILKQILLSVRVGGLVLITTRSFGMLKHNFPNDYWRYEVADFRQIFTPVGEIIMLEKDPEDGVGIILQRSVSDIEVWDWAKQLYSIPLYHIDLNTRVTVSGSKQFGGVSLVMIVKDAETTLRKCLDSVKDFVNDYVIVDTGSTDGTKGIIGEYSKVVEIPFENFVVTKNKALELATQDYILFMDADEYFVQGVERIFKHIETGEDAVMGRIIEGNQNEVANTYKRFRLWKNLPEHRFVGPGVHEVINVNGTLVTDDEIITMHDHSSRTPESYRERLSGYHNILMKHIESHPDDTRAMFYLGRNYKDLNFPLMAIEAYAKYLTMGSNYCDEIWQAHYDSGLCWKSQGEYFKASECANNAIKADPRRAEAWLLMGDILSNLQDWEQALKCYQSAILPMPQDVGLFLDPRAYSGAAQTGIATCLYQLKEYRAARDIYQKFNPAKPDAEVIHRIEMLNDKCHKKIFLTLGHTPEPVWGGMISEIGVGGVETTYLELGECLSKMGHEVFMFCDCGNEHVVGGVRFIPTESLVKYEDVDPDVVVSSRWFEPLYRFRKAKKIIWLQDAHYSDPAYPDVWKMADAVVVSSPWHYQYSCDRLKQQLGKGKLRVIPLGIRKGSFVSSIRKDPKKVIYSSNPDRGLFVLKDMWGEISEQVPGVHLTITYGWEGLKTWGTSKEWQAKIAEDKRVVEQWVRDSGNIQVTGRLPKYRLYEEMQSSSLCLYPNTFWESFCLTALETQATGTPMITTDLGALGTTLNREHNVLLIGDPLSKRYQKLFIDQAVGLLGDSKKLGEMSAGCRNYIASSPCDWLDIANQWERLVHGVTNDDT